MVYKTICIAFLAFVAVPLTVDAELFRDLSVFAEYDSNIYKYRSIDNVCSTGELSPIFIDPSGKKSFGDIAINSEIGAFRKDLYCDRLPLVTETTDVLPLWNSNTRVYQFARDRNNPFGNPASPIFYLKDQFGFTTTRTPIYTGIQAFSDSSGISSVRFGNFATTSQPTSDYALTGIRLGGRERVYTVIVTNDNLDYIDTASELYSYIDSQNLNFDTVGDTDFNFSSNTRFNGLDIFGSTTINISAGYYLDSSEINSDIPALNPRLIRYQISLRPSFDFNSRSETITPYSLDINSTTTTQFTDLDDGIYDLSVGFYNNNAVFSGVVPFADSYIYSSFEIASSTLVSVGETEIYNVSIAGENDPRYLECSITNITNCIVNALIFTFLPSENTLNRFLSLRSSLETIIPFGYFLIVYDTINNIQLDNTDYIIENIPFQNDIFTPLRNGIGYILWVIFAFALYRRFKNYEY